MFKGFRVKSEHTRIHASPPLRTSLRRDWVSADMRDGVYVVCVTAHTCAVTIAWRRIRGPSRIRRRMTALFVTRDSTSAVSVLIRRAD